MIYTYVINFHFRFGLYTGPSNVLGRDTSFDRNSSLMEPAIHYSDQLSQRERGTQLSGNAIDTRTARMKAWLESHDKARGLARGK